MTPADLRAWQDSMGLSALAASKLLGVNYSTYRDWLAGVSHTTGKPIAISRTVGLACAAIAAGLGEWNTGPTSRDHGIGLPPMHDGV